MIQSNNTRISKIQNTHTEESIQDTWTEDIELIINNIRSNCVILSDFHKQQYIHLKSFLKYFRIPTIILAGINSVISVGLQPYCEQKYISVINCILSLVCGVITSIELYLSIQSSLENELICSKEYHILSLDIYKVLSLNKNNRTIKGSLFLETIFNNYEKLVENSSVTNTIQDKLLVLNPNINAIIEKPKSPQYTHRNRLLSLFDINLNKKITPINSPISSLNSSPICSPNINIKQINNHDYDYDYKKSFNEKKNFNSVSSFYSFNDLY